MATNRACNPQDATRLGLSYFLVEVEDHFDGVVVGVHFLLEAAVFEIVEDAILFDAIQKMLGVAFVKELALFDGPHLANDRLAFDVETAMLSLTKRGGSTTA